MSTCLLQNALYLVHNMPRCLFEALKYFLLVENFAISWKIPHTLKTSSVWLLIRKHDLQASLL